MIEKIIIGIKYRLDEKNMTAEVIKKRGYEGEIIIPEYVDYPVKKRGCKGSGGKEYSVNSIAESAFEGCSLLTSITIPDSVTHIGVHAFNGCISLKTIQYDGTKAQLDEKITLEDEWNKKVPAKVISCTDGSVDITPNELQQNPMFRLSMSSLELFHSNFLEWLFDIDHAAFLTCFGLNVNNSFTYTIERECHLGIDEAGKQWVTDIAVFKNGNLILIIENKIKSTPSKGQLKYQSELANELAQQKTADAANEETDAKSLCKKVLLSLFEYSGTCHGFIPVLYKDLIGEICTNYALSNLYIKDYCDMLKKLQDILDNDPLVTGWKNGYYTAHLSSKKLEIYDMMDAFRKYQAASLADKFETLFIKTDPKTHMSLCKKTNLPMTCEHSLNNKHACTTIAYELNDRLNVGVQIEHDQLRIFFEDKEKNFNIPNVHECWNSWFDVDSEKIQGVAKKNNDQQYCSYDMSKTLFIYRYVKLDDLDDKFVSSPITINDLCKYVEGILDQINKNSSAIIREVLI